MNKRKKRAGVFALAIMTSVSLYPLQPGYSAYAMGASDFTDVKDTYWGCPYIDFSAGNGIINGYPSNNGTYQFLPEKQVTREEAASMLYRVLSAAGKLKSDEDLTTDYEELFTENHIAEWARKSVSYGLQYGLITDKELADFTDEKGLGQPASREQVAVWTAKAMDRNLAPAYSLTYSDKDDISKEVLPYVDLLYRQGIMQGDDKKMFHPADGVKRVEFAAICNRVFTSAGAEIYAVENEIQSYRGVIVSTDAFQNRILMTQSDGTVRAIQINPKTQIVIDGKVNYNGFAGITTGVNGVIAWGAFKSQDESDQDNQILQLHIITQTQANTGTLTDIRKLDDESSLLKIKNENGDLIYYILDRDSKTDGKPKTGKKVTFIADGIKVLELKQ